MAKNKDIRDMLKSVGDNNKPYRNKKCADCGKPAHQGYNGRWYCNNHHPQKDKLHKNPKAS